MIFLNPKRELWKWGPIEGMPIYQDPWFLGMEIGLKKYPPGWPISFSYFFKEKIFFIADKNNLYDNGEKVFKRLVLDNRNFKKIYKNWLKIIINFQKIEKQILVTNFKKLNNKDLFQLLNQWNNFYGIIRITHRMGSAVHVNCFGGYQIFHRVD